MPSHPQPIYRPRKPGPKGAGVVYPDPRGALLDAVVDLVADYGYSKLTIRRLRTAARIPKRVFDQLFDDLEVCFLAACDRALADLTRAVAPEYLDLQARWPDRVRRTLAALLLYCDEHPDAADLLFLQTLIAGRSASRRRAQVLKSVANRLHADAPQLDQPSTPSSFPAEFVVQAVAGVIQARLQEEHSQPLRHLLGDLTAAVILPYLGRDAAAKHLKAPKVSDESTTPTAPPPSPASEPKRTSKSPPALPQTPFLLTGRTLMTLKAAAENPGASNRPIATAAGIADGGQASKLLNRLQGIGWLAKTAPQRAKPNAWWITPEGTAVLQVAMEQLEQAGNDAT